MTWITVSVLQRNQNKYEKETRAKNNDSNYRSQTQFKVNGQRNSWEVIGIAEASANRRCAGQPNLVSEHEHVKWTPYIMQP